MPLDSEVLFGVPAGAGTQLGRYVLVVGPPGSGCPFTTVQGAVDFADTLPIVPVDILLTPKDGSYTEDVLVRRDKLCFSSLGFQTAVIRSITVTECTLASLANFNATGNPEVLIKDNALPAPPLGCVLDRVVVDRDVNNPVWVGDASASIRFLGAADVPGTIFGSSTFGMMQVSLGDTAANWAVFASRAVMVAGLNCVGASIKTYNLGQLLFLHGNLLGGVAPAAANVFGDSTLNMPAGGIGGAIFIHSTVGGFGNGLIISGLDAVVMGLTCTIGSIDVNTTAASPPASPSIFLDCHTTGAINMNDPLAGPAVLYVGGRYITGLFGPGAANFTGIAGFNS